MADEINDPVDPGSKEERVGEKVPPVGGRPAPAPPASPEPSQPVVVDDKLNEAESESPLPFPIVGIGASAGRVEAYIELFGSLTPDTGMAFLVITHLLADHKSHLAAILGRHTPMPVSEIVNGVRPEPNHVYVLIYLGADLQKQILPTFHYALRPNGYLLLGTSETIREFTALFHSLDRKHKFFARSARAPRAP